MADERDRIIADLRRRVADLEADRRAAIEEVYLLTNELAKARRAAYRTEGART